MAVFMKCSKRTNLAKQCTRDVLAILVALAMHSLHSHTLYTRYTHLVLISRPLNRPAILARQMTDIIFWLGQLEGIFRVSLALLQHFKPQLLACNSFESIMDFLRSDLPNINLSEMDLVLHRVFKMDLTKKLACYEVEYNVVQEEMQFANRSTSGTKKGGQKVEMREKESQTVDSPTRGASPTSSQLILSLQAENKTLHRENMELTDQLHVATSNVNVLESQLDGHKSTMKRLELRVRALEDERDALLHSVNILRRKVSAGIVVASLSRRSTVKTTQ